MAKQCSECFFFNGNPYTVSMPEGKGRCGKFEKRLDPIVPVDEAQYCAFFTTKDGKSLTAEEIVARPKRT